MRSERPNLFVVSDTHFGHVNILGFMDKHGKLFRGELFKDVDHMNEIMVDNWNKVVKPHDHVLHLGDVHFGSKEKADLVLSRLNGRKDLILGNHDDGKSWVIQKHFHSIELWNKHKSLNGKRLLFSHVPVHESVFPKDVEHNFHGHIHEKANPTDVHTNLGVEKTGYAPVPFEEIFKYQGKGR